MNINSYNYLKACLISPKTKIGNVKDNAKAIIKEIENHAKDANILVFPELSLTSASCYDLFLSHDIHHEISDAITEIISASAKHNATVVVGSPFYYSGKVYNVGLFISAGKLLGIVPKSENSPYFSSPNNNISSIFFNEMEIPFGTNLVFSCKNFPCCNISITIGKPALHAFAEMDDANIVINIDAASFVMSENVAEKIRCLSELTQKTILYVNSNASETTTDSVFGSEMVFAECGKIVETANTLQLATQKLIAEMDLDLISCMPNSDRIMKKKSLFLYFSLNPLNKICNLHRNVDKNPYFCGKENLQFCQRVLEVQALGLAKRLEYLRLKRVVLGLSGGIDSTLALFATLRAFEILNIDKAGIYVITMPGLASSVHTQAAAKELADLLNITYLEIPINSAVKQHFSDIDYDIQKENIVFENAQARQRTMILFNYANKIDALVVGTGDMSEIALGWSTFNGDHISHYNVNAGVPKTIARMVLQNIAEKQTQQIAEVLLKIINFPISPELVPADEDGNIQETEKIVGPYILHDFFMYYYLKHNLSKKKIVFLAKQAFSDEFTNEEIDKYINIFWKRFFSSQYKRSCSPDGPSIFDISLSPRIGLKLSSDVELN